MRKMNYCHVVGEENELLPRSKGRKWITVMKLKMGDGFDCQSCQSHLGNYIKT